MAVHQENAPICNNNIEAKSLRDGSALPTSNTHAVKLMDGSICLDKRHCMLGSGRPQVSADTDEMSQWDAQHSDTWRHRRKRVSLWRTTAEGSNIRAALLIAAQSNETHDFPRVDLRR